MPNMNNISIADILELPAQERIRLVELIWDSVAAVPEAVEISPAQKAGLDARLAEFKANPEAGYSWDQVKSRLKDSLLRAAGGAVDSCLSAKSQRQALRYPAHAQPMTPKDFHIGLEFWCSGKRWRCTDVGSRVVVAISLEAHEVVSSERDPNDPTKRIERRYMSSDPRRVQV